MDCSGSLARLQQGEQTAVGVGDLFQRYKRTMVSWVRVTVKSVFFKNKFVMKFVKKTDTIRDIQLTKSCQGVGIF